MSTHDRRSSATSRRAVIAGTGGLILAAAAPVLAQQSEPGEITQLFRDAKAEIAKGRILKPGRISLDIPRLAESGNSVPIKVAVASPMSEADHVRMIHILSEKNPVAVIARFHMSPRAGRAEVATNIRLAATQNVHVIAEMSDGTAWTADTEVVVLLAACLEGI